MNLLLEYIKVSLTGEKLDEDILASGRLNYSVAIRISHYSYVLHRDYAVSAA